MEEGFSIKLMREWDVICTSKLPVEVAILKHGLVRSEDYVDMRRWEIA
jgi:hypothetical protein